MHLFFGAWWVQPTLSKSAGIIDSIVIVAVFISGALLFAGFCCGLFWLLLSPLGFWAVEVFGVLGTRKKRGEGLCAPRCSEGFFDYCFAHRLSQRDSMPTVYLKEQRHTYSNPSVTGNGNMLYMNYPSPNPYSDMLAGDTNSQQNCIDLPASTTMTSYDSSVVEPGSVASRIGEPSYNALRDGRNEMLFIQTVGGSMSGAVVDLIHSSITDDPQMDLQTPLGILNGQNLSLQQGNISAVQGQGLSLSLSTQIPISSFQYPPATSDIFILSSHQSTSGNGGSCRDDDSRNRLMNTNLSPYALSNLMSTIPSARCLKAAQQLLDEVVNIQKTVKHKADRSQSLNTSGTTSCKDNDGVSKSDGMPLKPQEFTANSSTVLSPSERQDLQNKLTKLLAMLDEVDRRYKQYYQQLQIVVSCFDVIAGCGAAKPYTALALQTISRQFRNLRDAIDGQIRSTQNSLGEKDSSSNKGSVITRLRYIDHHLRQQRAIQQLGMFQQNAWRPQRGLPETSVSILRSWLFEHFLHPYPSDAEKIMLARQTGLSRSQISNWFINARVRLWKPMIEDMHKEENGDTEAESNSSSDNTPKDRDEIRSSKEREDQQSSTAERRHHMNKFSESHKSNHISNSGNGTAAADLENNLTASNAYMYLKPRDQRPNEEDRSLHHDALAHSDGSARFMTCQMADLGNYGNSRVSLTLGLQHCDGVLPMSHNQQGFLTVRGEDIYSAAPPIGAKVADHRRRFGPPHPLHDFVA